MIIDDLQDEPGRTGEPRPFPFLPTVDPRAWTDDHLGAAGVPAIVYRSVAQDTPEAFEAWIDGLAAAPGPRAAVFMGSPTRRTDAAMGLPKAYALARAHASELVFGVIAIAERHARRGDEHGRIFAKLDEGCRFFVTQAAYDVTATKSLLSDVCFALRERGREMVPMVLTFSPCASRKTLAFMKWLGISFPRWLDNELHWASDPLATSVAVCEAIFADAWEFARAKDIPRGGQRRERVDSQARDRGLRGPCCSHCGRACMHARMHACMPAESAAVDPRPGSRARHAHPRGGSVGHVRPGDGRKRSPTPSATRSPGPPSMRSPTPIGCWRWAPRSCSPSRAAWPSTAVS